MKSLYNRTRGVVSRRMAGWIAAALGVTCAVAEPEWVEVEYPFLSRTAPYHFDFTSDPLYYFILHRNQDLADWMSPIEMEFGVAGPQRLSDLVAPPPRGFYRVQRVLITEPQDSDGDGMDDVFELLYRPTVDPNVFDPDTDGDGLPDGFEVLAGTDPDLPDTDGNGENDGDEDPDWDSLTSAFELAAGTHPGLYDMDGDSFNDEAELTVGTSPRRAAEFPLGIRTSHAAHLVVPVAPLSETGEAVGVFTDGPVAEVVVPVLPASGGEVTGVYQGTPAVQLVLPVVPASGGEASGVYQGLPAVKIEIEP